MLLRLSLTALPILVSVLLALGTPGCAGRGFANSASGPSADAGGNASAQADPSPRASSEWLKTDCPWPASGRAAVSLTYDDAMPSHLAVAVPALKQTALRATFFLNSVPADAPWAALLSDGHELAAHTPSHPCPRSYGTPSKPSEEYDLESFTAELDADVAQLKRLGATAPYTFAYPCGVTWIGQNESYIPLVKERFSAARGVGPGPAAFGVDLYQTPGNFSFKTAAEMASAVDQAVNQSGWAVFGFHGIGSDWLITDATEHEQFLAVLKGRDDVWVAPFGEVAACAAKSR